MKQPSSKSKKNNYCRYGLRGGFGTCHSNT